MYSLSLDHSGRSSQESRERWAVGFSGGEIGEEDKVDCLWRTLEGMMSAVGFERLSVRLKAKERCYYGEMGVLGLANWLRLRQPFVVPCLQWHRYFEKTIYFLLFLGL